MPKLYLLAVGGTGVRVTKSLINLLATGVPAPAGPGGEPWKIVPLVIDPHKGGSDLLRMSQQLKRYRVLHEAAVKSGRGAGAAGGAGWFGTELRTVGELIDTGGGDDPIAHLGSIGNRRFGEYIGIGSLTGVQRAMASALYDERQLGVTMDIGFVGNPAIGVVALEELNTQPELRQLADSFAQGDRVFIVSSIFGGTGSAAFPILVKLLRDGDKLPNAQWLKAAPIGALSVQPYFRVGDGEDDRIRQVEFMQRTKAALSYYQRTLPGKVQRFYTIGENSEKAIDNDPGEGGQRNPAHLVELLGALSVLDFLRRDGDTGGRTEQYQYALKDATGGGVIFESLADADRALVEREMTTFAVYARYLAEAGEQQLVGSTDLEYLRKVGTGFGRRPDGEKLLRFFAEWREWLAEMAASARSFAPFDLKEDYAQMVRGVDPKKGRLWGRRSLDNNDLLKAINEAQVADDLTEPLPHLLASVGRGVREAVEETYAFA